MTAMNKYHLVSFKIERIVYSYRTGRMQTFARIISALAPECDRTTGIIGKTKTSRFQSIYLHLCSTLSHSAKLYLPLA